MAGSGKVRQIVAGLEAEKRKLREEVQRLKEENQRLRIQIEGLEDERDSLQIADPGPGSRSPAVILPDMPVSGSDEKPSVVGGDFSQDNPAVPCDDLEDEVTGLGDASYAGGVGPSPR